MQVSTRYSGPIPSAKQLKEFDDVVPGAARDIINEFRAQGRHRRFIEKVVVVGNSLAQWAGLAVAGYLAYVILDHAYELLADGKSVAGLATAITAVTGLVVIFVVGKKQQTKNLAEKIAGEMFEALKKRQDQENREHDQQMDRYSDIEDAEILDEHPGQLRPPPSEA